MEEFCTFNNVEIKELSKGTAYSSASINLSIRYVDEEEYINMQPEEKSAVFDGCLTEAELIVSTNHDSFDSLNAGKIINLDIKEDFFATTSFKFLIIKKERTIKISNYQSRIFYTGIKFGEVTHDALGIFNIFVPKIFIVKNIQNQKMQLIKIYNERQKTEFVNQFTSNENYEVISLNEYLHKMENFSKTMKIIDLCD